MVVCAGLPSSLCLTGAAAAFLMGTQDTSFTMPVSSWNNCLHSWLFYCCCSVYTLYEYQKFLSCFTGSSRKLPVFRPLYFLNTFFFTHLFLPCLKKKVGNNRGKSFRYRNATFCYLHVCVGGILLVFGSWSCIIFHRSESVSLLLLHDWSEWKQNMQSANKQASLTLPCL